MLKKGVTIVIYCFIILSFIILVLPENTKAVYTPIIHLEWAEGQEVQFADVEPGELNYVIFSGTIGSYRRRCSMIYDIYVELKGSTDMGWPVNITPSFFHLYGWNERAFSVIVELIPGLNINTTGNLFVYGNGTVYPGGNSCHVVPITGTIKINKYNQYYMASYKPSKQVVAGDNIDFNMSINNIGNGIDSYMLDLHNIRQLNKNDIKVHFQEKFLVDSKKFAFTDVLVKTTYQTKPGKYELNYKLGAIYNETEVAYLDASNFTFTIFVKENYQYPLTISFIIVGIIIILVLIAKNIQIRKKTIKKFYKCRIQPLNPEVPAVIFIFEEKTRRIGSKRRFRLLMIHRAKSEPPPRIPPPGKDHVRW